MIVVDSSALLAVFFDEAEKLSFQRRMAIEDRCLMSAVNAHEAGTVVRIRRGRSAVTDLLELMSEARLAIVPFDEVQVRAAIDAFDRFGKGIHSQARLNLCDCAAYALAVTMAAPLLFKGDDFVHTDLVPAV